MSMKMKVGGLALVAILAFSAIASAAQAAELAPRWEISTGFLGAGVTKTYEGTSTTEVKLSSAALNLKSPSGKCSATGTIEGSAAGSPGTGKASRLTCTEVKVVGSEAVCTVKSPGQAAGTVQTELLKGRLVWLNQANATTSINDASGAKFVPESGANFVKIEVSGASCPVANAKPYIVTGEEIGELKPVAMRVLSGELNFPTAAITKWFTNQNPTRTEMNETSSPEPFAHLKLGKEGGTAANASFIGNFSVTLNPQEEIGVFPG